MSGRKRKVFFLEPFFIDGDGERVEVGDTFWQDLLAYVKDRPADERLKTISGFKYRGATRSTVAPAATFLYIGKRRPRQDWPDQSVAGADEQPLSIDGELVEPMYLLPVTGGKYVATLRTSGGPSFAAAEEWVNAICKARGSDGEFGLRPVVRQDALERLKDSLGVTMFDLKMDPGGTVPDGGGQITSAVRALQEEGGVAMQVGLRMSFGNVTPNAETAKGIARHVEKVITEGHGIRRAVAKVVEKRKDGSISKEEMQFFYDRMTQSVEVGQSATEAQTPEVVMTAMGKATTKFREQLRQIASDAPESETGSSDDEDDEGDAGE